MCLAVAGKIREIKDQQAVVDIEGNQVKVNTMFVPEAGVADNVLVHAGFAISILSEEDYQEHLRIMKELEEHAQKSIDSV